MLKSNCLDMYEGVHTEMVYTNIFNKNSALSTTFLGQTKMTRHENQSRREISYYQTRFHFRKFVRWHRMSNFVRHRSYQILHASKSFYLRCKSLHALAKFCLKHSKNTSRKWTICGCTVCNSSNYRHPWP